LFDIKSSKSSAYETDLKYYLLKAEFHSDESIYKDEYFKFIFGR